MAEKQKNCDRVLSSIGGFPKLMSAESPTREENKRYLLSDQESIQDMKFTLCLES